MGFVLLCVLNLDMLDTFINGYVWLTFLKDMAGLDLNAIVVIAKCYILTHRLKSIHRYVKRTNRTLLM